MSRRQQRGGRRVLALLTAGIAAILLLLVGVLWLAYRVAGERFVPRGPRLIYSFTAEQADELGPSEIGKLYRSIIRRRIRQRPLRIRLVNGTNRIEVRLPSVETDELNDIRRRIERQGRLYLSLVNTDPEDCAGAAEGKPVPGFTPFLAEMRNGEPTGRYVKSTYQKAADMDLQADDWLGVKPGEHKRAVLVNSRPEMTGEELDLDSVRSTADENGRSALAFAFEAEARRRFQYITERNKGRHLAIIVDDVLYSAPVIRTAIPGRGVIASPGGFAEDELHELLLILRSGTLPAELTLEEIVPAEPETIEPGQKT